MVYFLGATFSAGSMSRNSFLVYIMVNETLYIEHKGRQVLIYVENPGRESRFLFIATQIFP